MYKYILALLILLSASVSFSQRDKNDYHKGKNNQGVLKYDIVVKMIDSTSQVPYDVNLFPGSSLDIYFSVKRTKITLNLEGVLSMSVIADYRNNKGLKLFKSQQGNFAIPCSADEAKLKQNKNYDNQQVVLIDETREILGFKCKKAFVFNGEKEMEYWYTEDISFDFSDLNLINTPLPGFPLIFSTESNGMLMTYEIKSIEQVVQNKDDVFSIMVPEGYEITEDPNK